MTRPPGRKKQRDADPDEHDLAGKDPLEVLRSVLAISPEDAKKVRKDAAKAMESEKKAPPGP